MSNSEQDAPSRSLARWLAGRAKPLGVPRSISEWLPLAAEEDVLALFCSHALGSHALDATAQEKGILQETLRIETEFSLRLELETRRVFKWLDELDIPALALKGNALAHWAYPQPHLRSCSDVDVLLPSRNDAETLARRLVQDGFSRAATSGDQVAHELMCTRQLTPDWSIEVDAHWRLSNTSLFTDRFSFDELMAASIAIPALGPKARGLGPVHALLHAAMHRGSNIMTGTGDRLKWLYDFVVLTQRFSESDWRQLVTLSTERQLAGITLSVLVASSDAFGFDAPAPVLDTLRLASTNEPLDASRLTDWRYMQAQTLRALPGWSVRGRWLWQSLFPSQDYLVYRYGKQAPYALLMLERLRRARRKLVRKDS